MTRRGKIALRHGKQASHHSLHPNPKINQNKVEQTKTNQPFIASRPSTPARQL
jgi:hypothetical protein